MAYYGASLLCLHIPITPLFLFLKHTKPTKGLFQKNISPYKFACMTSCVCWCWGGRGVTQSSLSLCNLVDCSPPSSSVHGISQARILEWVAISSTKASLQPRDQTCVSCIGCCCCCCWVALVVFNSVRPHRRQPTRLRRPWDSPGKTTGVGCHFLLQ